GARDVRRRSVKGEARFGTEGRYRRTVTLGGVPDAFVYFSTDGFPRYSQDLRQMWAQYEASLLAAGASIKCQPGAFLGNGYKEIQDVVQTGTPPNIFVQSHGHGFGIGDEVRIKGTKFLSPATNTLIPQTIDGVYHVQPTIGLPLFPAADWFIIPK